MAGWPTVGTLNSMVGELCRDGLVIESSTHPNLWGLWTVLPLTPVYGHNVYIGILAYDVNYLPSIVYENACIDISNITGRKLMPVIDVGSQK